MTKYLKIEERVSFKDGTRTERGEPVYSTLDLTLQPYGAMPIHQVIRADDGVGFTEEWIEEMIQGCLENIHKDFPNEQFKAVRIKPNVVRFDYVGVRGLVQ